jgi:hypothetical protein
MSKRTALFDRLVCIHQQRLRNHDAEVPGGLEVDRQIEFHGLLDRQVGGLGASEDPVDVIGRTAMNVDCIRTAVRVGNGARAILPARRLKWL